MAHGVSYSLGRGQAAHYSSDNSDSGWNGWLYPVLFVILPIIASLMVLALIACNVYEYYQKKKRLQQYEHYSEHIYQQSTGNEKTVGMDAQREYIDTTGYNESQYTYNTIVGNYFPKQDTNVPIRPMSGWVAPHI